MYFTTLGSQTKRWYGKLRQINPTPEVVNNVVLYNALFDVENPDRALMTQMTAQVFFVTAQAKDAVLVPVSALRPVGAGARQRGANGESKSADGKAGERQAPASGANASGQALERANGVNPSGRATGERASAAIAPSPSPEAKAGAAKGSGRPRASEGIDPRTRFADGRAAVRVLKADGTIEEREVSVGVMSRVSAQILSGLEPGEQVVSGQAAPAAATKAATSNNAPRMQPRI